MVKKKPTHTKRRLPRLGNVLLSGVLVAIIGAIVVLVADGVMNGGGRSGFTPDISETRSDQAGDPFDGGPRLFFPVDEIDMGKVPLNTNVSYAFAVSNVGDSAARIEDVDVSILEGC